MPRRVVAEKPRCLTTPVACQLAEPYSREMTPIAIAINASLPARSKEAVIARYSLGEFACAQADRVERRAAPARAARELETA